MTTTSEAASNRHFAIGLARAFAGAIIFTIAMLMTMEMWWLGFYMAPLRLALFTLVTVLLRLAHDHGFGEKPDLAAAVIDGFVGYSVGFVIGRHHFAAAGHRQMEWAGRNRGQSCHSGDSGRSAPYSHAANSAKRGREG